MCKRTFDKGLLLRYAQNITTFTEHVNNITYILKNKSLHNLLVMETFIKLQF